MNKLGNLILHYYYFFLWVLSVRGQIFMPPAYISPTSNCPKYQCVEAQRDHYCSFNDWPNLQISSGTCASDEECFVNDMLDGVCLKKTTYSEPTPLYPGQKCDGVDGECVFGRKTYKYFCRKLTY